MKKNLFILKLLLIVMILLIPSSLISQERKISNLKLIKKLYLSKYVKEISNLYHKLGKGKISKLILEPVKTSDYGEENETNNTIIYKEKIEKFLKKISKVSNYKIKRSKPIFFSKLFGEKPDYRVIRAGTRGVAVIAIYLAEKKEYKKSLNLIKHLFTFSLAMANDSINYEVDGTGSLLEYMVSIAIFEIITETSVKIIKDNNISQKEIFKFQKFIINVEKVIPGMLLTFKSVYGQTKKMIKELKKHEIGFFTYIERESFGDDSKVAPMEFYIIDAIRESEDASYVYDLFLEDSLSELKEFYTKLWSLNGIPYDKMKNILSSIDYDLTKGKSCRNFLSMVAIPNFMRAKEQEMKIRKKLKKLIEKCDTKIKTK